MNGSRSLRQTFALTLLSPAQPASHAARSALVDPSTDSLEQFPQSHEPELSVRNNEVGLGAATNDEASSNVGACASQQEHAASARVVHSQSHSLTRCLPP
jgi:hypothetical protein